MGDNNEYDYYESELKSVLEKNDISSLKLKVTGSDSSSKYLSLNEKSIYELREFLNKVHEARELQGLNS